ncbi:MAG: MG2 domain-containing protein, partial [Bacteroidetes bacterium]|nr:MG2 domain-containing protein [Bacteroidota bacterium]
DIDQKGKKKIEIPSLREFKVLGTRIINGPNPCVVINFSDPLDPEQDARGLVRLGSQNRLSLEHDNNFLRIYPPDKSFRQAVLYVDAGIRNMDGHLLSKPYSEEIVFEDTKPEVRFLGNGVILPRSEGLIVPFEAINLSRVDIRIIKIFEDNVAQFLQVNNLDGNDELKRVGKPVYRERMNLLNNKALDHSRWNTYFLDLAPLIDNDPGAVYNVTISFKKAYSLYECADNKGVDREMEKIQAVDEEALAEDSYWEDAESYYYDYYPDNYNWNERDNPCNASYYNQERFPSRNILASDLGIIAKTAGKDQLLAVVTDLRSSEPMGGVDVEVYNYQKQLIKSGVTGRDGMVTLDMKEKPYLLIAKKGKERGYLRLDDGSSLSLSQFDVSGAAIQKGLKGFIYGERGVWRPGDTLFLCFILEDKNKTLPPAHPVTLEINDPSGQLNGKFVSTSGINGFYRFTVPASQDAVTGNWTAVVKVGGAVFTKNLKIETVKPNRLKINLDFGQKLLSMNEKILGRINVAWLTGALARNLKVSVNVTLESSTTTFANYKDYRFDDPTKKLFSEDQVFFDGKTDEKGFASFTQTISENRSAPGIVQAGFTVRAFEEGGDASTDYFTLPLSTYKNYVGIKIPRGDKQSGMLVTDQDHQVLIGTVDPLGNPVSVRNLEVEIFKLEWRWWFNSSGNNQATYEGDIEKQPVFHTFCSTSQGKGSFSFRINYPDWGRYLIRVKDPVSGHSTGTTMYIDWPSWQSRENRENPASATMLAFTSDKEKYKVGDEAVITIPSSGKGRALVSLESGSKIVDAYWVNVKEKETVVKFKLTREMSPNIYVHVTLVQPHAQTVNDLPLRLYGVIPLSVYDPSTQLEPVIDMPAVLRPEENAVIKVRERSGKPMTYTIALVDEGLLDLTRFKTPDPWKSFYAREALGIKSWDMFDLVLGAYGGKLEKVFAIGGDMDLKVSNPKKANRFKPMVVYLGPFAIKGGVTGKHIVKIPSYVGSVRAMVIAGQEAAYGAAEKTVPVRKPLMVLATLPRVLGPGETVKLPVTVFAMEKGIKEVNVQLSTNQYFEIAGPASKKITFSQTGDQVVTFDLKVKQKLGIGKVEVKSVSGKESAAYSIEIDVRNPNPPVTDYTDRIIQPKAVWKTDYQPIGIPGTRKVVLEISHILPINLESRLDYLIQYPHGCLEQITSGAFPQLFLSSVTDLMQKDKDKIQVNIKAALQKLRSFQLPSGGFGYWQGAYQADEWATNYAGNFLIEAEALGYVLPGGMKESWKRYQVYASRIWAPSATKPESYYPYRDLIQAYRLYTLALAMTPQLPAMYQLREQKNLSPETRSRLAAAYLLAGQRDIARQLIKGINSRASWVQGMEEVYGSVERDKAMNLETLCLLGDVKAAYPLALDLSRSLNSQEWMSTQTTAYTLIALARFMGLSNVISSNIPSFSYTIGKNKAVKVNLTRPVWKTEIPSGESNGMIVVQNLGGNILYTRIIRTGIPATGEVSGYEHNIRMEVAYRDLKGKPLNINKLSQGADFLAEVTLTTTGGLGGVKNMALSQVFPSGWEIINTRITGQTNVYIKDIPTYQDYRDDRVYTYFDLPSGITRRYIVLLHASYPGRYFLSGPYCEAMYDNRFNARKAGQWVEVVR